MKLLPQATLRLMNQQLSNSRFSNPGDLLHWMGAIQAQNYEMAKWALGIRLQGSSLQDIENAIEQGEIIRTHVLRPTWHFVASEDLNWLLDLTAPRIRTAMRSRHKQLGLTDTLISKSNRVIKKALVKRNYLTRSELVEKLEQAGFENKDNRASHLLLRAELDKVICSGPSKGKNYSYALFEERVPASNSLGKEEALAKLATTYFQSHGPATLEDFVWWSGLTKIQAKEALALEANLKTVKINGRTYWHSESYLPKEKGSSVYLLPAYDEYLISYKDREDLIRPKTEKKAIFNNGIFRPIIVVNGQVTGTWKRSVKKEKVVIETNFFEKHSTKIKEEVKAASKRFAVFVGKELELDI